MWEFPGGKVEEGESNFEATSRELTEELGLTVQWVGSPHFAVTDPGSHFVIEFIPVDVDGSPRCIEHSELRGVSRAEMLQLDLAPSDRGFVEHLLTNSD
jgi:8-oxo-dGTP diphosphatase